MGAFVVGDYFPRGKLYRLTFDGRLFVIVASYRSNKSGSRLRCMRFRRPITV